MQASTMSKRLIASGFTTAIVAALLTGCAAGPSARADLSASTARPDLASGRHVQAIAQAEAAVASDPNNAAFRLAMGNAYLDAGRFSSAEAAFTDAMTLGDTSPRASLALALSRIAQAKYSAATEALSEHETEIARADLGLALALAGQPERGIHVMSNAIRGGENNVKMRQNLAYAYAMAGRWREARLMASQDVPAGEVGARLEQWSRLAPSDAYQYRVASLLGVPVGVEDAGQPAYLALGSAPAPVQFAAEAVAAPVPAQEFASNAELPAIGIVSAPRPVQTAAAAPVSESFVAAFAAPAPSLDARRVVAPPAIQQVAAAAAPRPATRHFSDEALGSPTPVSAVAHSGTGTHLVQLGSFLSETGAQRAWNIYVARYPELSGREMVLTEAVVRGRHYWRVSAGGFDQRASSAMCSRVRSGSADGCVTWAANRPLPGAIDSGVRLARR